MVEYMDYLMVEHLQRARFDAYTKLGSDSELLKDNLAMYQN